MPIGLRKIIHTRWLSIGVDLKLGRELWWTTTEAGGRLTHAVAVDLERDTNIPRAIAVRIVVLLVIVRLGLAWGAA